MSGTNVALKSNALSILLDQLDDGIVLENDSARIVFVNDAATRIFGRPKESFLGMLSRDLLHQEIGLRPSQILRIRTGESVACSGPDGRPRSLLIQHTRLFDDAGEELIATVIRDRRVHVKLRKLEDQSIFTDPDLGTDVPRERINTREEIEAVHCGRSDLLCRLAREIRRSERDSMALSIVIGQWSRHMDQSIPVTVLKSGITAEETICVIGKDDKPISSPVRFTGFSRSFDQDYLWTCSVLPGWSETEAYAEALRIQANSRPTEVGLIALGVTSLPMTSSNPLDEDQWAQRLLDEAVGNCKSYRTQATSLDDDVGRIAA